MALKPTIYKLKITLSDLDRNYYDALDLIIAQHPSEKAERMMVRILAFCINAQENLSFTKGLSTENEPEIWAKTLDDRITLWIDVGEPTAERIKKATRIAKEVKVYSFNSKSDIWWKKEQSKFLNLNVSIFRFERKKIEVLTKLLQRTSDMSVTITNNSAFVTTELGECEIFWETLHII